MSDFYEKFNLTLDQWSVYQGILKHYFPDYVWAIVEPYDATIDILGTNPNGPEISFCLHEDEWWIVVSIQEVDVSMIVEENESLPIDYIILATRELELQLRRACNCVRKARIRMRSAL